VVTTLDWARRLQAIAQTGVAYDGTREYDRERYEQVRQIAAEMFASNGDAAAADAILALEVGHATPKLDVRGVVFRGDEILLVREDGASRAAGSTSARARARPPFARCWRNPVTRRGR
jgi:hypothetical protein